MDERGSKIARNSVFNCHLSPVGRQMSIENIVYIHMWTGPPNGINPFKPYGISFYFQLDNSISVSRDVGNATLTSNPSIPSLKL